jgi:hypothetical protein
MNYSADGLAHGRSCTFATCAGRMDSENVCRDA